jgi:hypothetical protein
MSRAYKDESGLKLRKAPFRNRGNNLKIAAMFEMYMTGKSIEEVAAVYGELPCVVYEKMRRRGYEFRHKPRHPTVVVDGIKFSYSPQKNVWRSTNRDGQILRLHRYLWEKSNGPIPDGYGAHFTGAPGELPTLDMIVCKPMHDLNWRRVENARRKTVS